MHTCSYLNFVFTVNGLGILKESPLRVKVLVLQEMIPVNTFFHITEAGFRVHYIPTRDRKVSFKETYAPNDQMLVVKVNKIEYLYLAGPYFAKERLYAEMRTGVDVKVCVDPRTFQALVKGGQNMIQLFCHCMLNSIWGILRCRPGNEIAFDAFQLAWLQCDVAICNGKFGPGFLKYQFVCSMINLCCCRIFSQKIFRFALK